MGAEKDLKGIVVFVGKSGAGKDTLAKLLVRDLKNSELAISTTSRPKRSQEVEGVDYYFVSNEKFEEDYKNDLFLDAEFYFPIINEVETKCGYGINLNNLDYENNIIVLSADLKRAKKIKKKYGKKATLIYVDVPERIRQERAKKRDLGFSYDEWNRRVRDEETMYKNVCWEVDWIITNYNFEGLEHALWCANFIFNK